jgi:pyruvate formate lyase activating enzyme
MSRVECQICPNRCIIDEGDRGLCRIRMNLDGDLYLLTYGKPCAVHIDPIEKKPAYHFYPGSRSFSIATAGCCLDCKYCQNWQISQATPEDVPSYDLLPQDVVRRARESGCASIAYTYTEPTVFYEYMLDTARLAHENGIFNVYVTCGYINEKPLIELAPYLDAANIDLKAFNPKTYRALTRGEMEPVLKTIKYLYARNTIVEITHLVVPTFNDSISEIRQMSRWIVEELSADVPLHLSRFHPSYKLTNLPATSIEFLTDAYHAARAEGLNNVYVGNVPSAEFQNTYCAKCGALLIERKGYTVRSSDLHSGACAKCGATVYGRWP